VKVTKDEILNLADKLIRDRGYNGFSYSDISKPLKIKNSSIHYHFPMKDDLGAEVIKRATGKFIHAADGWRTLSYKQQLANYVETYAQNQQNQRVCLTGALSPVYDTLSPEMQRELKNLVTAAQDLLIEVLTKGKEKGEFRFTGSAKAKAAIVQSSLISSLLLDRVLQNEVFEMIQDEILNL
jgi:TetR/AcrR family transcriptional repressor of nem operon